MPVQAKSLPIGKARLIACKAIAPFINKKLLVKNAAGDSVPADGAMDVRIDAAMKRLDVLDQENGLKSVEFITKKIRALVKQEGFIAAIGKGVLLDPQVIKTIGQLAGYLKLTSMKNA